ncbi:MAG: DUF3501 family protein [Gemmatimonadetes bacterium]|nr:DUF3501 family protein [Gemmatimonadota bacterium]
MIVDRNEIVDYQTYTEGRERVRQSAMAAKDRRRIHVGEYLTFLFENDETVRYQIQEMMRAEQIVKESAIQHEIDTYNELLGGPGELGCSLLIEIEDADQRAPLLSRWLDLPRHLYVEFEDGERVYAKYDPRQVGEDRLSAVQYLKFDTKGRVPARIGSDHPDLNASTDLTEVQRKAIEQDLGR